MGRRPKEGLDYFPFDVGTFDDEKVIELLDQCGPGGFTVYIVILTIVYSKGYYVEYSSLTTLAYQIIRRIGNKWIKKDFVLQVIHVCSEIGLLEQSYVEQNVITSAGLQQRYSTVTVRNKVNKEKYWLLDKKITSQPLLNDAEKPITATEKPISATEMQQRKEKESKEKNIAADADFFSTENDSDEDDGMDPMEAFKLWKAQNGG